MKLSLVEYSSGINVSESFRPLIDRANNVIKQALHTKRNVLVITDGKLCALGVAGKMRLSKDIELEIVPKILDDQGESDWRESLFLLAALSKYGNIITSEHIHSSTAYKDSLYDIAGRILAREYSFHCRKPIRQYRRERFKEFSIEGEIEFDSVYDKSPDGIPQERVSFDKINPYNMTIQMAMRIVLPYVKEASIRHILDRAIQELGHQSVSFSTHLKVPSRNKEWMEIYNLSFDIVSGMGSSLENGEIMSPSFIVDTWRIWEWLITIAFKIGLGNRFRIIPQATIHWGQKRDGNKSSKVNVFPDVAIYGLSEQLEPVFLVDAKYKDLSETTTEIDRSDLYEAFAFCHATGAKKLFLAYPMKANDEYESGSAKTIAHYEIDDVTISVVKIAFGSITKQGDITAFCRKLSNEIMAVVA